jgi:hypothetical protein
MVMVDCRMEFCRGEKPTWLVVKIHSTVLSFEIANNFYANTKPSEGLTLPKPQ